MKVSLSTLRKIAEIASEYCGEVQPKIIFKKAAPVVANHKATLIYFLVLLVILLVLLNVVLLVVLKVLAAQPKSLEGPSSCVLVFEENPDQLPGPIEATVVGLNAIEPCAAKEDCIGSNVSTASRYGSDQSAAPEDSELRAFADDLSNWQLSAQSSEVGNPQKRKTTERDGYRGKQLQAK